MRSPDSSSSEARETLRGSRWKSHSDSHPSSCSSSAALGRLLLALAIGPLPSEAYQDHPRKFLRWTWTFRVQLVGLIHPRFHQLGLVLVLLSIQTGFALNYLVG
jgi:hypothetical protein